MIYESSVLPMSRGLAALSAVLAKAEAHCAARKIEPSAFLTARLFPDMFPLTRQVQLACDFAARTAARLADADVQSFPDTETGFAELQARIARVRDYIGGFRPDRFVGAESRPIPLKLRGVDTVLSGLDYLTLYALPQFYFHAATSYNILRHGGIEIGKADFMGV